MQSFFVIVAVFCFTALPNGFQYKRPRVEETKQMVGVMESQKIIASLC